MISADCPQLLTENNGFSYFHWEGSLGFPLGQSMDGDDVELTIVNLLHKFALSNYSSNTNIFYDTLLPLSIDIFNLAT